MMRLLVAAFGFLVGVLLPTAAHAQQAMPSCPYINTETTSGALGLPATLALREQSEAGDLCNFTAGRGKAERRLYVVVRPMQELEADYKKARSHCAGEVTPVNALGNDAWSCTPRGVSAAGAIFGRVRDTFFWVQMSGIAESAVLSDKLSLAAEQVANNLY
ncbi:MAG: hypothetical protein PW735_10235 [Acidobacteriaceae bacterium]|nr:hypothetical protein [Acidobacteriaceae bacterium]